MAMMFVLRLIPGELTAPSWKPGTGIVPDAPCVWGSMFGVNRVQSSSTPNCGDQLYVLGKNHAVALAPHVAESFSWIPCMVPLRGRPFVEQVDPQLISASSFEGYALPPYPENEKAHRSAASAKAGSRIVKARMPTLNTVKENRM